MRSLAAFVSAFSVALVVVFLTRGWPFSVSFIVAFVVAAVVHVALRVTILAERK
jgi:hypothetical protein